MLEQIEREEKVYCTSALTCFALGDALPLAIFLPGLVELESETAPIYCELRKTKQRVVHVATANWSDIDILFLNKRRM